MEMLKETLKRLWAEEDGEIAIEYGLLVALVALGLIVTLTLFKDQVGAFYTRITDQVVNAPPGP